MHLEAGVCDALIWCIFLGLKVLYKYCIIISTSIVQYVDNMA